MHIPLHKFKISYTFQYIHFKTRNVVSLEIVKDMNMCAILKYLKLCDPDPYVILACVW